MTNKFFYLFFFVFLMPFSFSLFTSYFSYAQTPEDQVICDGDQVEYFEKEKKIVGSGNVEITYGDIKLNCDKVTVWTEAKDAQADGNIIFKQGDNVFEGESIKYNFQNHTGKIADVKASVPPWYAGGEEAERLGKDEFVLKKAYITTCDQEKPHWKMTADRVSVIPGKVVSTYNAFAWLNPFSTRHNIPLIWIPYYSHPLDDNRPHVVVVPGKNSDWGAYALTAWRYNLSPAQKGYVHIDYREKKDLAGGVDYIYDSHIFGKGMLTTYYMNERQIGRDHVWDSREEGEPTTEEEKALLRLRHKWQASPDTLVTAELHKYRDEDLLKDYFYNDYEKDENPESYILASHSRRFLNFSLLTKKRVNRFDDTVERLPEGKLDVYNVRLLDTNFYYKSNLSAVNLNRVYPRYTDEFPGEITDPEHVNRYDSYNQLSYKSKLGFLYVTPYAGTQQTYYDRMLDIDEGQLRGAFYTGVDVSTKFFKVFHTNASPLGMEINNIRHIITPAVGYDYIPPPTMHRDKVFQFDGIDALERTNLISLGLENKLQTKRGKDLQSVDMATLLVETGYDFKHTPGTQFTDYAAKLELKPFDWLTVVSNATIDSHKLYRHEWLKELSSDIFISSENKWSIGMGHRYVQDFNNMILQGKISMIPGWRFSAYGDLDLKGLRQGNEKLINDLKEQEYVITKDLHCWEMDVRYNVKRESGEEIMVLFRLKAFPALPFEFGKSYHRPKLGSQALKK
ncbi:MAG: LptA/OstA family protein [Candidatus Omnitrophota bacterium]